MSCSSTTNQCCPEAPAITLNSYVVTVGGSGANFHDESFALAGTTGGLGLVCVLAYTPVQPAGVLVFINGVAQRYLTDFTVSAASITLLTALVAGDVCNIKYIGTT